MAEKEGLWLSLCAISKAKCRHLMPRRPHFVCVRVFALSCGRWAVGWTGGWGGVAKLGVTDKLVETSNSKHAGLLATCAELKKLRGPFP